MIIQLSFAIHNLCKIVFPTPNSGKIIGMQREATESADDPDIIVVDKEHTEWDFKPWLQEKTNDIRVAYESLLDRFFDIVKKHQLWWNSPKNRIILSTGQFGQHNSSM
jgi:hypothetical protein